MIEGEKMGILRPKTQVLDEEHKKLILEEAKNILNEQGIFVENEEARTLLEEQGVNHDGITYYFPSDLVDKCVKSTPSSIKLYNREGKNHLLLEGDNIHFDPGSAAIFYLDENTGEIREPLSSDFIQFTKVVNRLPHIDAQSTAIVYSDVSKDAQDWHRVYLALKYGHKPVITGTFKKESFSIMKELLLSCRTSEDDLANKPLAIFDACPSPPLKWSDLTSQSVIDAARIGQPSEFVSMPLAGASGPVTLIGCITQHCAETLAGVVIGQLAKKGAPLIWGGSPSILDMKHGTTPMGAVETMLIDMGDVEMGKYINLPTHAYMGLSDSKVPDAQGGIEASFGAVLAGLAGVNMISGLGMLDFESCQSVEKVIIDNEIAGMVKRMIKGVENYGQPFAADILKDYDTNQELLSHPTTINLFRKEFYFPSSVITRTTREDWKNKGATSTRKRARDRLEVLLKAKEKSPIDNILSKELDTITKNHL